MQQPVLNVVMYHYVRDLPRTPFPRIKGMLLESFRSQVKKLSERYEMARLETALEFLSGSYQPKRDLCLLTFDDGLREHYQDVTPILAELGIQGQFFVISRCQEDNWVAPVHMNHFLTAALGFEEYRTQFLARLDGELRESDPIRAARTYPWDSKEVAQFKLLFNFELDTQTRDAIVRDLFRSNLGDEGQFARELYFNWEEGRQMQAAGMLLGGHTHQHRPLAGLSRNALIDDLRQCRDLLRLRLAQQELWPFSYPYGKKDSFDRRCVLLLRKLGFSCSFSTEHGENAPGAKNFAIRRVDCNRASEPLAAAI
jgi:peptidoglycan/xylan/chitin deacetylase (PgdA/CDA1 family)